MLPYHKPNTTTTQLSDSRSYTVSPISLRHGCTALDWWADIPLSVPSFLMVGISAFPDTQLARALIGQIRRNVTTKWLRL